jgi:hypothetical protein
MAVAVVDAVQKRTAASPLETNYPKNRGIIDNVEKDYKVFKGPENQCRSASLHSTEAMELHFPPPPEMATSRKEIDHCTAQRIVCRCEELKVKILLDEE